MSETETKEALLDLAQPRVIILIDRDHSYTLRCRRVTDKDWTEYFRGIRVSSEQKGKDQVNTIDADSPRLALAETVLIGAEGYKVKEDRDLTSIPQWQRLIPVAHRLKLGSVLADALPSSANDEIEIMPEGEIVKLDATWSASSDGTMEHFEGLQHHLRSPSEEQHRRYKREASRAVITGGSRTGKTVYPGAYVLLATLYDELVIGVDGYVSGDVLLGTDRAVICREMDMNHKVKAAQELFQPLSSVQTAGDDRE